MKKQKKKSSQDKFYRLRQSNFNRVYYNCACVFIYYHTESAVEMKKVTKKKLLLSKIEDIVLKPLGYTQFLGTHAHEVNRERILLQKKIAYLGNSNPPHVRFSCIRRSSL